VQNLKGDVLFFGHFLAFVCLRFRPAFHVFRTAMQWLVAGFQEFLERANQLAPELHKGQKTMI